MKKMLFAALLSLAGVGLSTGQASAWLFCHHCCRGCATICVRPYNAFTPSVVGSICADGCCPLQFGSHVPGPPPPWMAPPPWGGGCGMEGGCCGGGYPSGAPLGAAMSGPPGGAPTMLPPGSNMPNFQAPPPAQMPTGPAGPTTGYQPYPAGVQAAGYPGYAPMPWTQPQAYPTYWNPAYPPGR